MIGPAAEDWLLNTLRHAKGRLAKACSTVRLIFFEGTDATDLRSISRNLELHWTPPKSIANQIVHAYRANSSFD